MFDDDDAMDGCKGNVRGGKGGCCVVAVSAVHIYRYTACLLATWLGVQI